MLLHRLITNFLWLLLLASAIGLTLLILTVTPDRFANIAWFYLAILTLSMSFFTLGGFYLRRMFGQREHSSRYLTLSSRQALWLSVILVVSLLLSSHQLFSWVNAAFLALVFIFLESYLLAKNPNKEQLG